MEFGEHEDVPGFVGPYLDEVPRLTSAHVRPYIVAILLHRGAVKSHEVIASLTPHCLIDDLKVGEWDPIDQEWCDEKTRAEKLVDEVLGEFIIEGLVRYNEQQDLWVLIPRNLPRIISWIAATGASMPPHLLMTMSREQIMRLPKNVSVDPKSHG